MARVVVIHNPFDIIGSREVIDTDNNLNVKEILDTYFYKDKIHKLDIIITCNGQKVEDYTYQPTIFDLVGVYPVPHGGGGGNKQVVSMVAMVALAFSAPYIMTALPGAGVTALGTSGWGIATAGGVASVTTIGSLVTGGIFIAGALLINAVLPKSLPNVSSNANTSATYNWDGMTNPVQEGSPLPILYGTHRITPPIISEYLSQDGDKQYYNALYAVAGHEIDSISQIKVNDQALSSFSNIITQTRLGTNDQTAIPGFADVRVDTGVSAVVKYGTPITKETAGNTCNGLGVSLLFNRGLYHAEDNGSFGNTSVKIQMLYRLAGSSDEWTNITTNTESLLSNAISSGSKTGTTALINGRKYNIGVNTYALLGIPSSASINLVLSKSNYFQLNAPTLVEASYDSGATWEQVWQATPTSNTKLSVTINILPNKQVYLRVKQYWRTGTNSYRNISSISYNVTRTNEYATITDNRATVIRKTYNVSDIPAGRYEVQVSLYEEPPTGTKYGNEVTFESIQEAVKGDNFTYPNVALLAVKALATDQLSGGRPTITCIASRTTIEEGKSASNPAWACYDLITNPYAGNVDKSKTLIAKFQEWADYCDSKGYTCNVYMDTIYSLSDWVSVVAKLGWGNILMTGAIYTPIIDKEESLPVQRFMFNMGNILYGTYQEEYTSHTDRANSVEVTYYDSTLDYADQTVEIYQEGYDTVEEEVKKTSVDLIGCTNREIAIKYGKRLLNCNRYLTILGSWVADIDSLACTVGDVVEVAHDVPEYGFSGRLTKVDNISQIHIDQAITMEVGKAYAIKIKFNADDAIQEIGVINTGLTTKVLQLDGELDQYPTPLNDLYAFGEVGLETKLFRIIEVSRNDDFTKKITALEYVKEVYLDDAIIPVINESGLVGVKDLLLKEVWFRNSDGSAKSIISSSWNGASLYWDIYYRKAGTMDWTYSGRSYTTEYVLNNEFNYLVSYDVAVTATGNPDDGQIASVFIQGADVIPEDVIGFQVWQKDAVAYFRWNHTTNIDNRGYEVRMGDTWETGQIIADRVQENATQWLPPQSGTYKFMIKAVNNQLQYSENEATAITTINVELYLNYVFNRDDIPDYVDSATEMYNLIYDTVEEEVRWLPTILWEELGTTPFADTDWADYDFTTNNGRYVTELVDLGKVTNILGIRMTAGFNSYLDGGDITNMDIPDRTNLTYPEDTNLVITSTATYKPYYRYGDTESTLTEWLTWSGVADFQARYVQFRYDTDISLAPTKFAFTSLKLMLDVASKQKVLYNQSILAGGTTYSLATLEFDYVLDYNVVATVIGNTASYVSIDLQATSFTVYVYDISGVSINGTVNLELRGV